MSRHTHTRTLREHVSEWDALRPDLAQRRAQRQRPTVREELSVMRDALDRLDQLTAGDWLTRPHRGFTLVELIVTLVIFAVLSAIAIPTYDAVKDRARCANLEHSARAIDRHARGLAAYTQSPPASGLSTAVADFAPEAPAGMSVAAHDELLTVRKDDHTVQLTVSENYGTPGELSGECTEVAGPVDDFGDPGDANGLPGPGNGAGRIVQAAELPAGTHVGGVRFYVGNVYNEPLKEAQASRSVDLSVVVREGTDPNTGAIVGTYDGTHVTLDREGWHTVTLGPGFDATGGDYVVLVTLTGCRDADGCGFDVVLTEDPYPGLVLGTDPDTAPMWFEHGGWTAGRSLHITVTG